MKRNNLNIKEYYIRKYKDTPLAINLKENTTFSGLLMAIECHENINEFLFDKEPNEFIKRRIIAMLCESFDLEYEYIANCLKYCKR